MAAYISNGGVRLRLVTRTVMEAAFRIHMNIMAGEMRWKKKLTMSMSIAAPGLSTHRSSPHKLPLTLAAGVRVLIVIGSCVDVANANGIPSGSS